MSNILNDTEFKNEVEKQLMAVFSDGMKQGTKAICGVVLDEINSEKKTPTERLRALKDFCERSLNLKERG